MTSDLPRLLTEAEVANILAVSPRTVFNLRTTGELRYVQLTPRTIRYRARDVAEFIERRTRQELLPAAPTSNRRQARNRSPLEGPLDFEEIRAERRRSRDKIIPFSQRNRHK